MGNNDGFIVIAFECDNHCLYQKEVSKQEIELAIMCVLYKNEQSTPIFQRGSCHNRDLVIAFWEYFNVNECLQTTRHLGLFVKTFCVQNYNWEKLNAFCVSVMEDERKENKFKRARDGC